MTSAMQYPYTIILRVGLMYSLFILFLLNLFIKWWLDSSQIAKHTKRSLLYSVICLASYALFVSTIDRKRINYNIAEWSVFIAAITNFFALRGIYKNMAAIREDNPYFIGYLSWTLKRLFIICFYTGMGIATLIYFGQIDIFYKNMTEYLIVISSYLFYWTFTYDFAKFEMDIDKMVGEKDEQQTHYGL